MLIREHNKQVELPCYIANSATLACDALLMRALTLTLTLTLIGCLADESDSDKRGVGVLVKKNISLPNQPKMCKQRAAQLFHMLRQHLFYS